MCRDVARSDEMTHLEEGDLVGGDKHGEDEGACRDCVYNRHQIAIRVKYIPGLLIAQRTPTREIGRVVHRLRLL